MHLQSFIASLLPNASLYEGWFWWRLSFLQVMLSTNFDLLGPPSVNFALLEVPWPDKEVSDAHRAESRGRFVVTVNRKQWRL